MGLSLVNLPPFRFTTVTALCDTLNCHTGDLFTVTPCGGEPAERPFDELPTPVVNSVTFLEGRTDKCDNIVGLIADREVTLCFLTGVCANDTCDWWTAAARTTALHELAHAWIDDLVSDETRDTVVELTGLESGPPRTSPGRPRRRARRQHNGSGTARRGLEAQPELGPHSCAELTELFRLLVGGTAQPYPTCTPAP